MRRIGLFFLGEETTAEMVSDVILAEKVGFESVWMLESRFVKEDAFTMLGAFACATSRMKLTMSVINPYTRNPALQLSH